MFDGGAMSIAFATLVASTVILIAHLMKRKAEVVGRRYPPSISAISLLFAVIRGGVGVMPTYFQRCAEKLGPVLSCKLGGRLSIILNGRQALTEALVKQSETFSDRFEFWTETNIANIDLRGIAFPNYNDKFKKNRKISLSILKEFGFGVSSVSESRILHEVESLIEEIVKTSGHPFNPKYVTDHATANVVFSILFGDRFMSVEKNRRVLIESVHEFIDNLDIAVSMVPLLRFLPSFRKKINDVVEGSRKMLRVIDEAIELSKAEKAEASFVGRYLDIEGPGYDHQELLYIMRDLCLGSAETVTTTMQWAFVELANHPEIQSRLQREIDHVVHENRFPSLNDKPRLPYTEAVILELMRRRTIVPFSIPRVSSKDTEVLGCFVPKGSLILVNTLSAHMSPMKWKDPDNFDPERFLDKDNNIVGGDRVVSFGFGKRTCPGEILARQKVFLFFTSLAQRFDIRPPADQDSIMVKEIMAVGMHPSDFEVRLIPRKTL